MGNSLVEAYIEDIAKRIHDSSLYGAASVMVGAGFSKNAEVLDDGVSSPNWEELAMSMFEILYKKPENNKDIAKWEIERIKKTSGRNVLKLAEEYKSVFGRNKLNKFIEANINDEVYLPGNLHEQLLSLSWRDVFTTNYDTLLERTIDKITVESNYKILTNQNDLPGSTHPRIIKLHGSVDSESNYIISDEDYRTYPVKFAPFVNTVQQAMLETQLCLIGFSGDDPNFLTWLGWLRDNMGENCPNIYLIGLFRNMSDAEKMTLQSQNIIVVDLQEMFDEEVGHERALGEFLKRLREYGKEKESIFQPVPFGYMFETNDVNDDYYKIMNNYLSVLQDKTSDYIAFPQDKIKNINRDLSKHFEILLKQDFSYELLGILAKIIHFLRRSYTVLYNPQAKKIQSILDDLFEVTRLGTHEYNSMIAELSLYLLEMYRIDGRYKEHNRLIDKIVVLMPTLKGNIKEELQIEKTKYLIGVFNYNQALIEIEKINNSISLDIQLKKAFLYKQIGKIDSGIALVKKTSAQLSQRKYSDNKMASLKSYLNLCARSLYIGSQQEDNYSDLKNDSNEYNVIKIYNDIKNTVGTSVLLASKETRGKRPGFNPGTYKITRGTATRKEQDAFSNSFRYVMFQDLLCIPNTFTDHHEVYFLALLEVLETSEDTTWKWSSIIRTNNSKIINSFFTRELIISTDVDIVKRLYKELDKLYDLFDRDSKIKNDYRIINREIILDILSRFSIVMDDKNIIKLINIFIKLDKDYSGNEKSFLREYILRLRFSINKVIFEHFFIDLLESSQLSIDIFNLFLDTTFDASKNKISNHIFLKIVDEIKSDNTDTRERGILKAVLINAYSSFGEFELIIASALWSQLNEIGFPKSGNLYIWVWAELPYPQETNFSELYKKYFEGPNFPRAVNKGSISGMVSDGAIDEYIQHFGNMTIFKLTQNHSSEIQWSSEYFINIIKYLYEYIDNEKKILNLKFDIFGSVEDAIAKLTKIVYLISMIAAQAYFSKIYNTNLKNEINKIHKLLKENDISTNYLYFVERAIEKKLESIDIEVLINSMISGNEEEMAIVIRTINILLAFENQGYLSIKVSTAIIQLMSSLKYIEHKRRGDILGQLTYIIKYPVFISDENRDFILEIFQKSVETENLRIDSTGREYIEYNYSLSRLTKLYCESLIENKIPITDELKSIIRKYRLSKQKEVRNMWGKYTDTFDE